MTNLQDLTTGRDPALADMGRWGHRLRLLPLAAGGGVALLLLALWVLPLLQRLSSDQQRLAAMEEQAQRLPLLRAQLQQTLAARERAEAQKRQLLALIAGSGSLNTFMAQVDREAQRHGVSLDVLQPLAAPAAAGGKPAAQPVPQSAAAGGKSAAAASSGCGTLATPGLTASRQSLVVRGRYPSLLAFMRALETLNLLVVQCDLALEQPAAKGASGDSKQPPPLEPMLLRFDLALFEPGRVTLSVRGGPAAQTDKAP